MDREKIVTFEKFANKALRSIEEKKRRKTKKLKIGALDETIEIRALSDEELNDCFEYGDGITADKYTIYYASKTLQELASYMLENGLIKKNLDIVDMFSSVDRTRIANEILSLSGVKGESTVSEVTELKKS